MSYAGDVTPSQAYTTVTESGGQLIDCRTTQEWQSIGVPDVAGTIFVEWQRLPDGSLNPDFFDELAAAGADPETPVFFLCRSGARSQQAAIAATAAGYRAAYNVAHGFEGPPDGTGRRGTVAGWQHDGLPWNFP